MNPVPTDAELLERGRKISRELRKRRLTLERNAEPLHSAPKQPDIYYESAPCGEYPIVALRTVPCDRYVQGDCGPCSYSARSYPVGLSREALHKGLIAQIEWLLEHFDEAVAARSDGTLEGYRVDGTPGRPWYMLQLAGESSFLRDAEVPPFYRRLILERLARFQKERGVNLHIMLETRPEHLLAAEESGELSQLAPLFAELNVVVNMGFEARDDFLRNVVFAKALELPVFERALGVAHAYGLDPGVFVFVGGELLTYHEQLAHTRQTLEYLQSMGVFANVMVANLQSFTLPDLLYDAGCYDLPEPYFLLDLIDALLEFTPQRPHAVTPFDWFLGGLVADPPPRATILDHPRRRTSISVTEKIKDAVGHLVQTGDEATYRREAVRLRSLPEFAWVARDTIEIDRETWRQRWAERLQIALGHLNSYDVRMHDHLSGHREAELCP